ncbi:non-ribosomal peptide synthetase [Nonomuraea zeae]|uniref:Amino acid adenylation domain-containing protein n=1 Tax=Nonomuraea zeae TaxID=1642303 RepID=A0A5S4H581_9ACTN|nr:non-ribosomal peptide synthetase [Nonomuraea zeae]TMR39871.1 amino acid adenylation domain-containing protein [Nonomuraea zeae]
MTPHEQPIAVIAMGRFPQEVGAAEEAGHDPGAQVVRLYGGVGKACAALLARECELAVTDAGELPPGTLRGTLVLRLLDRALLDGDLVHRVIWPDDLEVEEGYPPVHAPGDGRPRVVVWSGRTQEEAESVRRTLAGFFAGLPEDRYADATGTLQQGRVHHPVRGAVVCRSAAEAALALGREHAYEQEPVRLSFPDEAAGLYGVERVFTEAVDVCEEALEARGVEPPPAFATAYGLAATLAAWGIRAEPPDPALLTSDRPLEETLAGLARPPLREALGGLAHLPSGEELGGLAQGTAGAEVRVGGDLAGLLAAVARFWTGGGRVDWATLDPDHPLQRLPIPRPQPELPASVEEPRPLPAVPYSFWVLEQLAPDSGVSNLAVALRFETPLRRLPLQIAVNRLVKRHPALRLRFPVVGGTPVRHLVAPQDAQLKVEVRATTEETLVADLRSFLDEPFDLGRDLLIRVGHFTLPDGAGTVVCLAGHHIVIDGISLQVLVEELGRFYDSQTGHGTLPPELAGPAPMLEPGEPSEESIGYWLDRLDGVDPASMVLPGSRHSPGRPTFAGHTCSWRVDAETVAALDELRATLRTTGNIVLATAFLLTLRGHGAGPDLVIGMPVSTRTGEERKRVGYAVSTLPLRVHVELDDDFEQVARRVEEAFAEGIEHADASVEAVLTRRGHGTDDWRVPLFRHMFNYRPWSDEKVHIQGEVPGYVEDLIDRSRLDLQCNVIQEPDRLTVRMGHSTEVHDEDEIAAFAARMCAVVRQAARGGVRDVLSPADRALLDRVNGTRRTWPGTLVERIAPGPAVAVREGGREVSYDELLGRAAAVRDLLHERGVRRGDVVALALDRSADLVAAVLGTWQAGAAFLPLDVRQPEARLAYQVADSGARLVVAAGMPPWAGETPVAPMPGTLGVPEPPEYGNIAYVIYTSGSTGRPKGVQVTHENLTNLVLDFADRLGAPTSVLWSTTTSFDISWLELLLPLASGGVVVVASDEDQLQPGRLLGLIAAADVQVVQATPTAWRLIAPEAGRELAGRTVLCGGEPMPAALARDLLELGCRLFNVYGPTETTIWSTAAELREPPLDPVPAGEPLANTQIFVTDAAGRELPPGVPGELCVAGAGVSAGYLNRPELTAERFGHHDRYGRFYRTGDRARIRHDGTLELLGRDDRQIKLRGHRIELGEVEAALHEHEAVRTAAVILDGDPQSDGRLVAFLELIDRAADLGLTSRAADLEVTGRAADLGTTGRTADGELWRFARTRLPDYAVPTRYIITGRLPTTANGKIAYRELVVPDEDGAPAREAGDGLVRQVVALWRDALKRPGLGPHDNFFLNGGHSVLAVRLIRPLEELAGRAVSVRAVFDHPTPAELALHLGEAR